MLSTRSILKISLFCLLVCSLNVEGAEQNIQSKAQAERLWQAAQRSFVDGNAQKCTQELLPLQDLLIGTIAYDRLLGLCAVGSRDYNGALFAFNRIMAKQPQNAEIRMERAQTYFALNLLDEAKYEFKLLAASNPPPAAQKRISEYLDRIDRKNIPKLKISTGLRVNLKNGYDSNANSASELQEFLGFNVSENSQSTSSALHGLDVRFNHSRPLDKRTLFTISTSLGTKHYPRGHFYNINIPTYGDQILILVITIKVA